MSEMNKLEIDWTAPFTVSLLDGEVVPIPTFVPLSNIWLQDNPVPLFLGTKLVVKHVLFTFPNVTVLFAKLPFTSDVMKVLFVVDVGKFSKRTVPLLWNLALGAVVLIPTFVPLSKTWLQVKPLVPDFVKKFGVVQAFVIPPPPKEDES